MILYVKISNHINFGVYEATRPTTGKGELVMYEKMYYTLFNAVTDAMELMEQQKYQEALTCLEEASRETEEIYISE